MNHLMFNRKVLAAFLVSVFVVSVLVTAAPVKANLGTLYVDDDGTCDGNGPCYTHPQDAVNSANPGDTINIYPGTYGQRRYTFPKGPFWNPGDQYAPALIVWKNGLTVQAVDPAPEHTVIRTDYNFWVNKGGGTGSGGSIQASTGGTFVCTARTSSSYPPVPWRCKNDCTLGPACPWTCRDSANNIIDQTALAGKYVCSAGYWEGDCVRPDFGTPPNAIAVIASNVAIRGLTLHRPFDYTSGTYNTAGVMIGGLYAGDPSHLGSDNNVVENSVFSDVWHAVYIWHSSGNVIKNNIVAALATDHWAAISTYDGYNDAQISLGYPSENNLISHNTLANKGIALGAWAPSIWTSNAGSKVCCNAVNSVGVTYSHGPVIVGCNTGGFWQHMTDNVIRVKGITYTGDTALWTTDTVSASLIAQLDYDGSSDGSGVEVSFDIDGGTYSATTVAGGSASTTADLPLGEYEVTTTVAVCDDCEFTDADTLTIGRIVSIDIKPGSDPNSINLKSKGVVPVAVMTTDDFDASTVVPSTVTFAGVSPVKWSLEDVNGDGRLDLVLHFSTESLVGLSSTSTDATLTGSTYDGIPIKGTDTVNIVPK